MSGTLDAIKSKSKKGLNKAKGALGIQTAPSEDVVDEIAEFCPKLSYQQRMIGFGSCFFLGYVITFMSFNFFIDLIEGNPVPFVMLYSIGNIISLFSSTFLCGPKKQFKNMFDKKRKIATIVYLSTLATSIIICFIPFNQQSKLGILVILLIVQFLASIWYSLSYIPFARRAVKKCFKNTIDEGV